MKLNLDAVQYTIKPSNYETKIISNRIMCKSVDISPQQLAGEILKGKSFTPAYFGALNKAGKLARSQECWTSQQVLCIDFDNETLDNSSNTRIKDIAMTIDDALEEFKHSGAFLYKSFGYKDDHPKFRVVLILNREVNKAEEIDCILGYYKNKYPDADSSCFERARLFYGGTEVIEINYDNVVRVDEILNKCSNLNGFSRAGVFSTPNNNNLKIYRVEKLYNNFKGNEFVEFNHINDAYEYLYKQDMKGYLYENGHIDGHSKNFPCLFHEDKNPSASVFLDSKTGNYMYKCHSGSCGFTGNIIRVVERIQKVKRVAAFKHLCDYYNVKLTETDWQKEQKEILDHNIHYMCSDTFRDEHPELYKRIKKYIPLLVLLNMLAKQYIGTKTLREVEHNIFTVSKKYIAEMAKEFSGVLNELTSNKLEYTKLNSDPKEISKRIDLFSFLGVLEKIHVDSIPEDLFKIAVAERERRIRSGKGRNEVRFQNYYSIPEYGDDLLTSANQKAIEFKKNNLSMTGFGREMVFRGLNKEAADKIYPMMSNMGLSNSSKEVSVHIHKKFITKIEETGWVLESDILDELIQENLQKTNGLIKGKAKNMKYIKRNVNELLESYDWKRVRLNKKLKLELSIDDQVKGFPFIVYREKTETV
ncbi:CHC2 zinc finger domain-containing protein [Brevibacillus brevis]|uniref:CHC2 zinc finger domain-containing protein n=1 Tax=Brevibacillus brevis TaxID=1393 RepID=UPI0007D89CD2|nr:CHC2 zinc finger domain-containing protein [Brevibacillus brevis]